MSGPRIVGLCEGFGGLTKGVQSVLGGELVAYAEIKAAAVALLAARFPGVMNLGDLTVAPWAERAAEIAADIITVGWPCQPHSGAGLRLGEEDPRAIWPAVLDVIATLRPALVVGENVTRIATNGELRRVVRSLAAIGYVGAWRSLPAGDASIGAPHRRDRVCLVAVDATREDAAELIAGWLGADLGPDSDGAGGLTVGAGMLPTPTARLGHSRSLPSARLGKARLDSGRRNLEDAVAAYLLPTPTAGEGARGTSDVNRVARRGGRTLAEEAVKLLPTPTVVDMGERKTLEEWDAWTVAMQERHGNGNGHGRSLSIEAKRAAHNSRWDPYGAAIARWEEVLNRPAPEPTRASPVKPYSQQLAPEFVEWMMGLEPGWVTAGAPGLGHNQRGKWTERGERNAMLSILGDGVVPQWAAAQLRHLLPLALESATAATGGDFFDALVAGLGLASTRRELGVLVAGARVWAPEHAALATLRASEPDLPLGPGWAATAAAVAA